MAIITQILCDHCGMILSGYEKKAQVHKNHIWIQGKLAIEDWKDQDHKWKYTFVTYANMSQLAFCDFNCLEQFSKMRYDQYNKKLAAAIEKGEDPELVEQDEPAPEPASAPTE